MTDRAGRASPNAAPKMRLNTGQFSMPTKKAGNLEHLLGAAVRGAKDLEKIA
jgi:hypothetical protein